MKKQFIGKYTGHGATVRMGLGFKPGRLEFFAIGNANATHLQWIEGMQHTAWLRGPGDLDPSVDQVQRERRAHPIAGANRGGVDVEVELPAHHGAGHPEHHQDHHAVQPRTVHVHPCGEDRHDPPR
jgi:hypothetical protein